jgi:hypothetical protein
MSRPKSNRLIVLLGCLVLLSGLSLGQRSISTADAKNHVGENATVWGQVASAHYATTSRGRPTFINLDSPYPAQIFTIVIWGSDRAKFGEPEVKYANKRICVTGLITLYRGTPEQIASDPSQVKTQ